MRGDGYNVVWMPARAGNLLNQAYSLQYLSAPISRFPGEDGVQTQGAQRFQRSKGAIGH